jgi:mono/diheme cytochrome c family protein
VNGNLRWVWLALGIALVLLGFVVYQLQQGWSVPAEAKARVNPAPRTPEALADSMMIYEDKCARCHGEEGKGNGPEAKMYSTKPADFTDSAKMSASTDGELFFKITEGRRPMPSYKGSLTEEQRWKLVHFLRTFAQGSSAPQL